MDEDEIDPLETFMNSLVISKLHKPSAKVSVLDQNSSYAKKDDKFQEYGCKKTVGKSLGRIISGEDSDSECSGFEKDEDPLEDKKMFKTFKEVMVQEFDMSDMGLNHVASRDQVYHALKLNIISSLIIIFIIFGHIIILSLLHKNNNFKAHHQL
ncbi:DEAD-box ATP-dependent RNA helicase 42 [Artemisia annua]|uniref:DEAD-box ATP-dependent RNA helicase 42 n=1 Tax=Artemisia annua TaxID=35608 RepID=A0A2U1NIR1_ARTAN|nr:DEAD-box ATP-dependent RNA helicase 42 [Artemisia annua]